MARKRRKTQAKGKRKTTYNNEVNFQIIGTIIFSVLLGVLLCTNSGEIGKKLNEVLDEN